MSNVCNCPKPPGGSITCNDDQLAVCGYQNGAIVSGCFPRPAHITAVYEESERQLLLSNWILSTVTGTPRPDDAPLTPDLIALLQSGTYTNEQTRDTLHFVLPRDLDFQLTASLQPKENMH
jgi:hypothetical protein